MQFHITQFQHPQKINKSNDQGYSQQQSMLHWVWQKLGKRHRFFQKNQDLPDGDLYATPTKIHA
jgi:hypothetical protein